MLALRLISPNDYTVLDDGQPIGRIRLARERSPPVWLWTVTLAIPGPPFGDAKTIDDAKARFKTAWLAFKGQGRSGGAGSISAVRCAVSVALMSGLTSARLVTREPLSREQEMLFLRRRLTFIRMVERRLKEQTETLTSLRERAERLPELSGPISPRSNGIEGAQLTLA